jgi:hypothetical protein
MNKPGIFIGLFILVVVALISYSTMAGKRYRVEVCMAFQGRSACKTVTGKSESSALRGGITNACADIAQGVTETMGCEQSPPEKITWLQKQ